MKNAITVNRESLFAWFQGILLDCDASGHVIVVNEAECEAAKQAMDNGETIYLTRSDGRIVSQAYLKDGQYEEHEMDVIA